MRFKLKCAVLKKGSRYYAVTDDFEMEILISRGVDIKLIGSNEREFLVVVNKRGGLTVLLTK